MRLVTKNLGSRSLAIALVVSFLVFAPTPAHAASTYCNAWFTGVFGSGNVVKNRLCVTFVSGRGYRGYVEFDPPQAYTLAGRFFVTLSRNGARVAKTGDRVNPTVNSGTTWPTAYVQKGKGSYCVTAWERRTSTQDAFIREACHALP